MPSSSHNVLTHSLSADRGGVILFTT